MVEHVVPCIEGRSVLNVALTSLEEVPAVGILLILGPVNHVFCRHAGELEQAFELEELTHCALCLASGLEHVHTHRLTHTDVKPKQLLEIAERMGSPGRLATCSEKFRGSRGGERGSEDGARGGAVEAA